MDMPPEYVGVWQRRLLRTPTMEDTTTTVFWLQTHHWHADIRIPADRPDCRGRSALAELSRDELLGLARQQGFAGPTRVEGDICHWDRKVDFQPPSGHADFGRMTFETSERCLEHGIDREYFDIWERLPESRGDSYAVTCPGAGHTRWLFRAGNFVMRVKPRAEALPQAASLAVLAADVDDARLRRWLDFELSFGRVDAEGRWHITHSTWPWLEGRVETLDLTGALPLG
jgi:hypothetical protein